MILRFGVLYSMFYAFAYTKLVNYLYKFEHHALVIILGFFSIHAFLSHHLFNPIYNPLWLLLFADFSDFRRIVLRFRLYIRNILPHSVDSDDNKHECSIFCCTQRYAPLNQGTSPSLPYHLRGLFHCRTRQILCGPHIYTKML